MAEIHRCHGSLVFLSNGNRTARRRSSAAEFNNGLTFSKTPLKDNEIFEVLLDRKIGNWSGSWAIGVTSGDPSLMEIPSSSTGLKNGSWIMSGRTILKDGSSFLEDYGQDLDELNSGERVGVQRKLNGSLHFFVNGVDMGLAASNIPQKVHAVVDLYGRCVEVSIYEPYDGSTGMSSPAAQSTPSTASVHFHPHCGSLIKLSNNNRTAERERPTEEFKNAVTLTNIPLRDDELFEVEIESVTELWAGSIEVGVTSHDPENIVLPPTMTSMASGTWMLSGRSVIVNGQEAKRDYTSINLETLKEGDRIGILKKSCGSLHFFINGTDLGEAVSNLPVVVYGAVDIYGAAVRVSIVSREEECERAINTSRNPLVFHPRCGSSVSLFNGFRSAHRPRANEEFNNAVVLTSRCLGPNELFEVCVDQQVTKWAGSVEIGITTHDPETLEFPSTMTNLQLPGTWMMSGGSLVCDGVTVIEDYGPSLDEIKVGNVIGVMRKEDGSLHFFVNGTDVGCAATGVPAAVYGVLDLFGQCTQVTIVSKAEESIGVEITGPMNDVPEVSEVVIVAQERQPEESTAIILPQDLNPSNSVVNSGFKFSSFHGCQVAVSADCRSAVRVNPLCEFNNAIVMSHRPLEDDEIFEVIVEKVVTCWSGSVEAGVCISPPEQVQFPCTMTDLASGSWMVSGSSVVHNSATILSGYACDLDNLEEGSRLGLMRKSDGSLHFFIGGKDYGAAATGVPSGVYAMINLYGQCVQLSVYDQDYRGAAVIALPEQQQQQQQAATEPVSTTDGINTDKEKCGFHSCCGKNISLVNRKMTAERSQGFSHALVFSAKSMEDDEIFEIVIDKVIGSQWSGSLAVGITTKSIPLLTVPSSALELRDGTWIMTGSCIMKDAVVIKENYGHCLDRLQPKTKIGVQRQRDGTFHVFLNGEDQGVAAMDVPQGVYAVVDVYGMTQMISISSPPTGTQQQEVPPRELETSEPQVSEVKEEAEEDTMGSTISLQKFLFHKNCGQFIALDSNRTTARRVDSYNHGVVLSEKPLPDNHLFQVCIRKLNSRWTGSVMIGVTAQDPDSLTSLPSTANSIKISPWIVVNNAVYVNGNKVNDNLRRSLDSLQEGDTLGVLIDKKSRLHLLINGEDLGPIAQAIPARRFAVLDLYGCCEEVSIVTTDHLDRGRVCMEETNADRSSTEHSKGPCDYRQLCDRFRASLAIPDEYFNGDCKLNVCYCQACHEARGEKRYAVSGDPPCRYALPIGWCQFALRMPPRVEGYQVFEKWHVSFFGTLIGRLRRILDLGDIPLQVCNGQRRNSSSNKENDVPQLCVSPTLLCACEAQSKRQEYRDGTTGKVCKVRVALQLLVKPGMYRTGPSHQQVDVNELLDQNLGTEDVEWYLLNQGSVVLTALLIKIEPI
ncbi:neuralized-like protein 4 [Acropora millepora]|uniref:neuralized-like protein 4 n=1 Tax=Acropora millepora TaxID=45264 RepID=UPI001CF5BCE5|nr:neuralized-like protein 4 [Acropora millepora]